MDSVKIHELRKQGRPLWMSNLGHEHLADVMWGAGGDIYQDRGYLEWQRDMGEEIDE